MSEDNSPLEPFNPNEDLDVNSSLDVNESDPINVDVSLSEDKRQEIEGAFKSDYFASTYTAGNRFAGIAGRDNQVVVNNFTNRTFYNQGVSSDAANNFNFYGSSQLSSRFTNYLKSSSDTNSFADPNASESLASIPIAQQFNLGNSEISESRSENLQRLFERLSYVKDKLAASIGSGIDVSVRRGGKSGDQILGISVRVSGDSVTGFGKPTSFNLDVTERGNVIDRNTGRLITSGVYSSNKVDRRLESIDVAAGLVASYAWSSNMEARYGSVDATFGRMKSQNLDYSAFNLTFGRLGDTLLSKLNSGGYTAVVSSLKDTLIKVAATQVNSNEELGNFLKGRSKEEASVIKDKQFSLTYSLLEKSFSGLFDLRGNVSRADLEREILTAFDRLNKQLNYNNKQTLAVGSERYSFNVFSSLKQQVVLSSPSLLNEYKSINKRATKKAKDTLLSPFLLPHDLGYSQGQVYARTPLMRMANRDGTPLGNMKADLFNNGINFIDPAAYRHGYNATSDGSFIKQIGATSDGKSEYATFFDTKKTFTSMSQLGYVSLDDIKKNLSQAGIKNAGLVAEDYLKPGKSEKEEELFFLLMPFKKAQQMAQRLKNMMGTRAAYEVDANVVAAARSQKSLQNFYAEDPTDNLYKLRADKFLAGNVSSVLPQVQFQELQRESQRILKEMGITKEDLGRPGGLRQEYSDRLIAALRRREFSPYEEVKGIIGGSSSRRVLVNMGISTMSDFSYLNKDYLEKSAFGYNHIVRFTLDKSRKTPMGINEKNFLYQNQLDTVQKVFGSKEDRFIYHSYQKLDDLKTAEEINRIYNDNAIKYGHKAAADYLKERFGFLDDNSLVFEDLEEGRKRISSINLKPGLYGRDKGDFVFFGSLNDSILEIGTDFEYVGGPRFDTSDHAFSQRRKLKKLSVNISAGSRKQQRGISFIAAQPEYIDKGLKTSVSFTLNTVFDVTDGSRFGTPNIKNPVRVVEGDVFSEIDDELSKSSIGYGTANEMPLFGAFNTSAFKGYNFDAGAEIIRTREGLSYLKAISTQDQALALAVAFMDKGDSELRTSVIEYLTKSGSNTNLLLALKKGKLGGANLNNLLVSATGIARLGNSNSTSVKEITDSIRGNLASAFNKGSFGAIKMSVDSILEAAYRDSVLISTPGKSGKVYEQYTFDESSSKVRAASLVADIISTTTQILNPVDTSKTGKSFFEYRIVDESGKAKVQEYLTDSRFRDAIQDVGIKAQIRFKDIESILGNKEEEQHLENQLLLLNSLINKPTFVQRSVNVLPSYSLTAAGSADAVQMEFQYLLAASKREYANLQGIGLDIDETAASAVAFKIATSYGDLHSAMTSGRRVKIAGPFVRQGSDNLNLQKFISAFTTTYSPALENFKLFGAQGQQSLADRLIISQIEGRDTELNAEQYRNLVSISSDYFGSDSVDVDRFALTKQLVAEFTGKTISTFGNSLDIADTKRETIAKYVSELATHNRFGLRNLLTQTDFKENVLRVIMQGVYKEQGITFSDIQNAVELITDTFSGSAVINTKTNVYQSVYEHLYKKDLEVINNFRGIAKETASERFIGGLTKIAAMSKQAGADNLFKEVYETQLVPTVDVITQDPSGREGGVIAIYDKNQIFSDSAPTNISFGKSSAAVLGLDVLQSVPLEFGSYTHELLAQQSRLREILPEYREIISRLEKGSIRNATLHEINIIKEFNELAVSSQESLANIGASILQQRAAGHAIRFPGASSIGTASYLLGAEEVVAGSRFTGSDSSIADTTIRATETMQRLDAYREPLPLAVYGNLKLPKTLGAFNPELDKRLQALGLTFEEISQYSKIKNKLRSKGSALNLTDSEFDLFNKFKQLTTGQSYKLGILRNIERTLANKPATREEEFYREFVSKDKRVLLYELLDDGDFSKFESYNNSSLNVLKEGRKKQIDITLDGISPEVKARKYEELERLTPRLAIVGQLFRSYEDSRYELNKSKGTNDFQDLSFFSQLVDQAGLDARGALVKATNLIGGTVNGTRFSVSRLEDIERGLQKNKVSVQEKLQTISDLKARKESLYLQIQILKQQKEIHYRDNIVEARYNKLLQQDRVNTSSALEQQIYNEIQELKDSKKQLYQNIVDIKKAKQQYYSEFVLPTSEVKQFHSRKLESEKSAKEYLKEEITEIKTIKSQVQSDIDILFAEKDAIKERIANLKVSRAISPENASKVFKEDSKVGFKELEQSREAIKNRVEGLKSKRTLIDESIDKAFETKDVLRQQITELKNVRDSISSKIPELSLESLSNKDKQAELTKLVTELNSQIKTLTVSRQEVFKQVADLKTQRALVDDDIKQEIKNETEIQIQKDLLDIKETRLPLLDRLKSTKAERTELKKALDDYQNLADDDRIFIDAFKNEVTKIQKDIAGYQGVVRNLRGLNDDPALPDDNNRFVSAGDRLSVRRIIERSHKLKQVKASLAHSKESIRENIDVIKGIKSFLGPDSPNTLEIKAIYEELKESSLVIKDDIAYQYNLIEDIYARLQEPLTTRKELNESLDREYLKLRVVSDAINDRKSILSPLYDTSKQQQLDLEAYKSQISSQHEEMKLVSLTIKTKYDDLASVKEDKAWQKEVLASLDNKLKGEYDILNDYDEQIRNLYSDMEHAKQAISYKYDAIKELNEDDKKLRAEYKESTKAFFNAINQFALTYEGKLKQGLSSVEAYKASKKVYRELETNLTSQDVYFHVKGEGQQDFIGYGVAEDYLRLVGSEDLANRLKHMRKLNKILKDERTIADVSGDYSVLLALENRLSVDNLTQAQTNKYSQIINLVKSKSYQEELTVLENHLALDQFRGDEEFKSRSDRYFNYKTEALGLMSSFYEKQERARSNLDQEKVWLNDLFDFYQGAASYTGYVERAGSPTGGSIVSQMRRVYSTDVLKGREQEQGFAFETASGYNSTGLIMGAYSTYSTQGGDWDGDSYSLVKGYDTQLRSVLNDVEDRNKLNKSLELFHEEETKLGLSEERKALRKDLEDKISNLNESINQKVEALREQRSNITNSRMYQNARSGMRRHAASVSGLPVQALADARFSNYAEVANMLEHHRGIMGNLDGTPGGQLDSMLRIFEASYNKEMVEDKGMYAALVENANKLRSVYGDSLVDEFALQLSASSSLLTNDKSASFNAFASQVGSYYNQEVSLGNLNSFVSSAAGQVLDLKSFETAQSLIGYLGTSLIGEGYNSLIELLPKAAMSRSIAGALGSEAASIGLDTREGSFNLTNLVDNLNKMGRSDLASKFDKDNVGMLATRASMRANALTGSLALMQQVLRDSLKPKQESSNGGLLGLLNNVEGGSTFVDSFLEETDDVKRLSMLRTFLATKPVQSSTGSAKAALNIFGSVYLLADYMKFAGDFNKETGTYDPSTAIKEALSNGSKTEYDLVRQRMQYYKDRIEGRASESDSYNKGYLNLPEAFGLDSDEAYQKAMAYDFDFAYRQTIADAFNIANVEEKLGKYVGIAGEPLDFSSPKIDNLTADYQKITTVKQVETVRNVFIRSLAGDSLTEDELNKYADGFDYIKETTNLLKGDARYKEQVTKILGITEEDITSYNSDRYIKEDLNVVSERQYTEAYSQLKNLAYLQESMFGISADDLTYLRNTNRASLSIKSGSYELNSVFDPFTTARDESQKAMQTLLMRGKLDNPEDFRAVSNNYLASSSAAMIEVASNIRTRYGRDDGSFDFSSLSDADIYTAASSIGEFTGTFDGGLYSKNKLIRQDYNDILVASLSKNESGNSLVEQAAYLNAGQAQMQNLKTNLISASVQKQQVEKHLNNLIANEPDSDNLTFVKQQYEMLQMQETNYQEQLDIYRKALNSQDATALETLGKDYLSKSALSSPFGSIEEASMRLKANQLKETRARFTSFAGLLAAPVAATFMTGGLSVNDRVMQMGFDTVQTIVSHQAYNSVGRQAELAAKADMGFSVARMRSAMSSHESKAVGTLVGISGELLIGGAASAVRSMLPKGKTKTGNAVANIAGELISTAVAMSAGRLLGDISYGPGQQEYEDYTAETLLGYADSMYLAAEAYLENMNEDEAALFSDTESENIEFDFYDDDVNEFRDRIDLGWIEVSFVDETGEDLPIEDQQNMYADLGTWGGSEN